MAQIETLPDQTKRIRATSSGMLPSFMVTASQAATGSARVCVPVAAISPAANAGIERILRRRLGELAQRNSADVPRDESRSPAGIQENLLCA